MKITKITVGRLYNLGSYEHVRYELTAEVHPGESAANAMLGIERVLEGLKPESKWSVSGEATLAHEGKQLETMREELLKGDEPEFRRRYGHFVGTPVEYVERCSIAHASNVAKRAKAVARAEKARKYLDDLGGASVWKDAKLEWENDYDDEP